MSSFWQFFDIQLAIFRINWQLSRGSDEDRHLPVIHYFRLVPESPRFLFIKGRDEEAKDVLKTIAKVNGFPVCDEDFVKMNSLKNDEKSAVLGADRRESVTDTRNENILSLFKNRTMLIRSTIVIINW